MRPQVGYDGSPSYEGQFKPHMRRDPYEGGCVIMRAQPHDDAMRVRYEVCYEGCPHTAL